MSRIRRWSVVTVGACALAAMVALGGPGVTTVGAQTSGASTVKVGDNYFKPGNVEVTAGTKVTWTNKGKILHSVKPNKGSAFGTKALARGKSYSYTFKKPGTYAYYCTFHGSPGSGQRGVIVVSAAPTTTTTGLLGAKSG